VKYKGKSINDILEMTISESVEFFENIPSIVQKLKSLDDVGLGYIKLGQPSTTLSGGESQRVKLAAELARKATGNSVYILDEPTTGLHFHDIKVLLGVLQRIVDQGNTVIVIEHNLDVIKSADWLIDLGPEGGAAGGKIIATGTPEEVAANPASVTGEFLKELLLKKL
ncbi:MAG: ATP-binding cassette domain-containing protein, partial [Bacteroidales bacterium]|nr:ATP-binding cassette domain-containing protein [Bacteroidales bacterium]MBQ7999522.1 ATP-binding cassette domain-containing protein [Bacteroidales bacterium]